jgi:hypothetical protein
LSTAQVSSKHDPSWDQLLERFCIKHAVTNEHLLDGWLGGDELYKGADDISSQVLFWIVPVRVAAN